MPKTFDISMLQTMISDHIKEMSDILTSGEDVQNYVDFCTSIFAIKAMMDYFYTPDSRGNLPLMDERQKMELFSLYGKAIEKAVPLLNDEAAGPAGIRMNSIVKEMLPLLHTDHMALEMSDPSGEERRVVFLFHQKPGRNAWGKSFQEDCRFGGNCPAEASGSCGQ